MRLLLWALTRTPLAVLYAYGRLIDFFLFHVFRWRRDQVVGDIALAFPDRSADERARILRDSYRNIADVAMESIWGYGASGDSLRRRVAFDEHEIIDRAIAAKQSVVLLAPHFCNWEWLLSAGGATFELPIDAVYQKVKLESVDRYLRDARTRFGGIPIPQDDFIYELMNRAGTPRGYALIADQTPPRDEKKHWTRFLNRDTAFFVGAEKIARFLDAPVLYVDMRRVSRGHYAVRFVPLAEPPYGVGEDRDDYSPVMEGFARQLERSIRTSPADWLWLQKRWKYPKAVAVTPRSTAETLPP
ncbi:MAG TPA: lysophospholipid acyltransferase family protein [Casimicrobiaceae bacterium]|nr:lysophospholipid acyltransferase family protein [Casimicrobiaceae bacterium]